MREASATQATQIAALEAELRRHTTGVAFLDVQGTVRRLEAEVEQVAHARVEKQNNILRTMSSEWEHDNLDGQIACHSRMVEGVLCRWWGIDEPPGVEIINAAICRRLPEG